MRATTDTPCCTFESLAVYDLGLVPYRVAQDLQIALRRSVGDSATVGALLLLEHEPVITLGAHASSSDVVDTALARQEGVDIVRSERGGQSTLHAPGQLVVYPIVRIPRRDLRAYVHDLEEVLLLLLARIGLRAERIPRRPGLYLDGLKIASLGLRCEHGIASHGSALNVSLDLSLFGLIVSCGDPDLRQTSIHQATGRDYSMREMKERYIDAFQQVFSPTLPPLGPVSTVAPTDLLTLLALENPRGHSQ